MIEQHVQKRIEREFEYQTTRIRNLLDIIYKDSVRAWLDWQDHFELRGFDTTLKKLQTNPRFLGQLNGTLWFNFWKTPEVMKVEHALDDLIRIAPQWYSADIQLSQMLARIEEMDLRKEKAERAEKRDREPIQRATQIEADRELLHDRDQI